MTDDPRNGASLPSVYTLAWAFYLIVAVGGLVWLGVQYGRLPLALFLDPGGWLVDVGLGLALGALLAGLWALGCKRLQALHNLEDRLAELLGPMKADQAVALAVMSGIAEEVLFRGAVLAAWGWIWATVLFALMHFGGRGFRLWALWAALAGLALAALVLWRGNLLPAILAHTAVNVVGLLRLSARPLGR